MDTTIEQQVTTDEALVPHAQRLRIRRSNFRLLSDIKSKESTLQLVYDVLRLCPFFKAFLVIADVLEIYMDMLHICPRVPGQSFVEPPFEEEILAFIRFLGHSAVEHKVSKKSNEMYYPRFTKFGALLPIELTNENIRNSNAYKEYYAVATGAAPSKPKASVRKTRSSSDTTTPPTTAAAGPRLTTSEKGKQAAKASKAKSLSALSEDGEKEDDDDDDEDDDGEEGDDDDDDQEVEKDDEKDDEEESRDDEQESDEEEFIHLSLSTHTEEEPKDEESFDLIPKTPKDSENGEDNLGLNVGREEGHDEEEETDELYRDVNINQGRGMESIFETTSQMEAQNPTSVALLSVSAPTLTSFTIATITIRQQAPIPPTTAPSTLFQDPPNFGSLFSFDNRLRTLETNLSEFMQTNHFAGVVFAILGIFQRYMDQRMNEAVKKIIKEHVKEQVKVQVSKILPTIEHNVNEQLEAEVLTRSSHSSRTSYDVVVDLSEMELKKILIEKIEGNKGDAMVMLIRMKNPLLDQTGGQKDREGKEPKSASAPIETATRSADRVDTLTLKLLAGPTYELMKGSCKSPVELEYHLEEVYKATTYQLDWVNPEGRKRQQFYGFVANRESARDVYSKRRIIAFTKLKIVKWHNYKHLDWITVRRDDDKLYKFKESDFKRLCIQHIEDMLVLLVQGKLTNLTVEERFAFNVSLRMFTRSIVIERRVEDLQLGVESYQKKLNLTKPNSYHSDLKRKEAYSAYSYPRGFIYQNKDKRSRLMQIDELHKFSDGTLTDVRTALDERLKGIRMQYLPQSIWRKSDKDRAAAMIHAIDKMLKTRRIMRSFERFVGGRLYKGDFRMLQRTI
nr:hypothetical protein [Tanacetum cinerariifolium]